MKIVLINQDFKDAYTGKVRKAGSRVRMTAERVEEIKKVNADFVTVVGEAEDPEQGQEAEKQAEK